jgi:hypothetical protein
MATNANQLNGTVYVAIYFNSTALLLETRDKCDQKSKSRGKNERLAQFLDRLRHPIGRH